MSYSETKTYESPLIAVTRISAENGFAGSAGDGYNSDGLRDFSGSYVTDQSNDWN